MPKKMIPDELDALPCGTVLRWPHNGCVWEKGPTAAMGWMTPNSEGGWSSAHISTYPVQVLWPTEES